MKKLFFILLILLCGCHQKQPVLTETTYTLNMSEYPDQTSIYFQPDGRFYGHSINDYYGEYVVQDNEITITIQANTTKPATRYQLEQEDKYFKTLQQITHYQINGNQLTLSGIKGNLIFTASNTD